MKSSNIFSLAHHGNEIEARFQCGACRGTGETNLQVGPTHSTSTCSKCKGEGHTGTYVYQDKAITPALFAKVMAGEPVENGDPSVGVSFNIHVKQKFKGVKRI